MGQQRRPIMFSPRRLARSLKDVPPWGHALAIAAAIGVVWLVNGFALYVIVGVMLTLFVAVQLADARYRRRNR